MIGQLLELCICLGKSSASALRRDADRLASLLCLFPPTRHLRPSLSSFNIWYFHSLRSRRVSFDDWRKSNSITTFIIEASQYCATVTIRHDQPRFHSFARRHYPGLQDYSYNIRRSPHRRKVVISISPTPVWSPIRTDVQSQSMGS